MDYRITAFFSQANIGWSETYWTPNLSAENAAAQVPSMLNARLSTLYTVHSCLGIRVAVEGSTRRGVFLKAGLANWPETNSRVNIESAGKLTLVDGGPDQVRACLQLAVTFGAGRITNRYLAGVPDSMTKTEPASAGGMADSANWLKNYSAFTKFLTGGGWRIKGRTTSDTDPIVDVQALVAQEAAPALLGIVLPDTAPVSYTTGDRISLTKFRPQRTGCHSINGVWYVAGSNTTLQPGKVIYWLRGSSGIDPDGQRIMGKVQRVGYTLYPLRDFRIVGAAVHKRGRPSGSPRGRRSTRKSLAP